MNIRTSICLFIYLFTYLFIRRKEKLDLSNKNSLSPSQSSPTNNILQEEYFTNAEKEESLVHSI